MRTDVLVVCTGNVCRSPYVEARLSVELPELIVVSAGTAALRGEPPTPETTALLAERGIDVGDAVARQVDRSMIRGAGLVVTAARRHRVEVVGLAADAVDRTFTLRELARLLRAAGSPRGLGTDGVRALAAEVVAHDGDRDHDDDLVDPFGRSESAYFEMAAAAEEALAVLVPALGGGRDPE